MKKVGRLEEKLCNSKELYSTFIPHKKISEITEEDI